jgi:hypothetical protein
MGNVPESLCVAIPSAATNEQMVRVEIANIEARPERMRELFSELAFEALQQVWSHVGGRKCRRRQNKTEL